MQAEKHNCQNCEKEFIIEPSDFEFYEKMSDGKSAIKIPAPTFCPECRVQRRMGFFNQTNLHKRKCDGTGKVVFSSISSDYPGKVYDTPYWWSDNWDAAEYARDYDFSKSFFEQMKELFLDVPRFSRSVVNLVNSDYCAGASNLKDCYLVFNSGDNENCLYGAKVNFSKDSIDNYNLVKSELCSNCFMVRSSYQTHYSQHCNDCREVYFSRNLRGCNNCFGCANLKNKAYYIFNKKYTKDEYEKKLKEFDIGSFQIRQEIEKQIKYFYLRHPVKYMTGLNNVDVLGNYINNSKNVKKSDHVGDAEDCKYCYSYHQGVKDSYDCTLFGSNAEMIYETAVSGLGISNLKFCQECYTNNSNLEYCINCMVSSNLFGCVGLRKKQYCIFNKQYTKEEFFPMVEKIKKQMNEMPYIDSQGNEYKYGEFFPPEFSTHAYNETIAQEYFPLTKGEALKKGHRWKDAEEKDYKITMEAKNLPDNIDDVDDSVLEEVVGCDTSKDDIEQLNCTTAFKITPRELEFYKRMNIPLPRHCPNCRHHQRLEYRNSLKLYKRICMKEGCEIEFETTYAPNRPEIVYCEKCYNNEVI
jgi:hypothetical protein